MLGGSQKSNKKKIWTYIVLLARLVHLVQYFLNFLATTIHLAQRDLDQVFQASDGRDCLLDEVELL